MDKVLTHEDLLKAQPWDLPGKWCVSAVNYLPEMRIESMPNIPKKVKISDCTLREAEDNIMVSLSIEQRIELIRRLGVMGLSAIDCGYYGNEIHEATLKKAVDVGAVDPSGTTLFLNTQIWDIIAQADNVKGAVDRIAELGGNCLNAIVFAPIVTEEQSAVFIEFMNYAYDKHPGFKIICALTASTGGIPYSGKLTGITDSFAWQIPLAEKLVGIGAKTIALADSMGCASTPAFKYIVRQFNKAIGDRAEISVHCHNDFGLAVGNSMAGVEEGATIVEVSACGLGARAGNTPLDEAVVTLEALYGVDTGIDMSKFYDFSMWLQEVSGAQLHAWKAVSGEKLWYESSWHVADYMKAKRGGIDFFDAKISESLNPKLVGQEHLMKFGFAGLNLGVIKGFLEYNGLVVDDTAAREIFAHGQKLIAERRAAGGNSWLEEDEVTELCRRYAHG